MKKRIQLLLGVTLIVFMGLGQAFGQYTTPTVDGSIGTNEYGSHTSGENNIDNWYMTWDATNLYVGITSSSKGEAAVLYLGTRTDHPINGGANSDGTLEGFNSYDGTNFAELPFRAKAVFYVKDNYREYRTSDGSNGWSSQTSGFGSYSDDGTNVREFSIPWSVVGGIPSSFSFFGYVTSSGGFVYNEVPSANDGGNIGTSARYGRYFIVSSTSDGSSTKPFSQDSYVFNSSTDISDFGTISVYDFTMNTNGSTITRTSSASNNWTIENDLVVADGTINFNSTSSTASVDNIKIIGGALSLSSSGSTTTNSITFSSGSLTTNGGVTISSGGTMYQTGGTLTGNVNIERQVSGNAGWRLLSIPKTGATVGDISDDTAIQGVTGGSDASAASNVYTYDDTGAYETPTNVSTAIGNGKGLAVYFFNNTTNGSSTLPLTLDASGLEPSSDVVVDLYSGATGRYTLVGNPFAANVNLANVSANIAISSNMTFWDNAAGSYTTQSTSGGLVIQPWQGYWVQTANSTAGGQLTFGTADKTSSAAGTTHFDKALPNNLAELRFTIQSSYNTEKNLTLQVANDASLEWDKYDLIKLGSLLPQNVSAGFVGSLEGKQVLKGIEGIPSSLDEEITFPILVDLTGESQTLNLKWDGLDKMPSSWSFKLHDYKTGDSYDLSAINQYDFEIVIDDTQEKANPLTVINSSIGTPMKAKSGSTPRFGITIAPGTSVGIDDEVDAPTEFALGQNYPNPFNPTTNINYSVGEAGPVNITVYNVMGQKVAELLNTTKNAGSYQLTWNATGVASGIYYYRLTAPGQVLTRQMTLIK
ncbi:MAG: T9SS type A sorting domain-containing protein [Balneola sp.]